ncbi:hypothetical protein HID58_037765 [Brassica napus]|uniref:Uncharacterized protein n=1 Tax=Brassica napus TaxID=3708 RepID=A0ABQ8BMA6_BRANA|nr:hypothetical protein HID58_037765 [Brassica napus]
MRRFKIQKRLLKAYEDAVSAFDSPEEVLAACQTHHEYNLGMTSKVCSLQQRDSRSRYEKP